MVWYLCLWEKIFNREIVAFGCTYVEFLLYICTINIYTTITLYKKRRRIDTINSRYEASMITLQLRIATIGRMILHLILILLLPNYVQAQQEFGVDPSNHYFCGLPTAGISTISNNCLSSQHCPSGSDNML